jgi:hypothetical protein
MEKVFTCELDGFVMRDENDDELAAQVERHIAEAHPELVGTLSAAEIRTRIRAQAEES